MRVFAVNGIPMETVYCISLMSELFMKAVMAVCPDSVALEWLGVDRGI